MWLNRLAYPFQRFIAGFQTKRRRLPLIHLEHFSARLRRARARGEAGKPLKNAQRPFPRSNLFFGTPKRNNPNPQRGASRVTSHAKLPDRGGKSHNALKIKIGFSTG